MWRKAEMTPTVRKRSNGLGFEAGPDALSYSYAVSLNRIVPDEVDDRPSCRNIIFDDGSRRIYKLARVGSFFEISFGKPGDPIPTVEITDVVCPDA